MINEKSLREFERAVENFGSKPPKSFIGALACEFVKRKLTRLGLNVSQRDVFVHGVPYELDLLISRQEAAPLYGLVYEPEDVLAAFEIKKQGSYGAGTINAVQDRFRYLQGRKPSIFCAYLTLWERDSYSYALEQEKLGFPCYTIRWYKGQGKVYTEKDVGDWQRFVKDLTMALKQDLQSL